MGAQGVIVGICGGPLSLTDLTLPLAPPLDLPPRHVIGQKQAVMPMPQWEHHSIWWNQGHQACGTSMKACAMRVAQRQRKHEEQQASIIKYIRPSGRHVFMEPQKVQAPN